MLKPVCDICHKDIKNAQNSPVHFCERCAPFAEEFIKQQAKTIVETRMVLDKTMEKFRNKFLQEVVVPGTRKNHLEVVNR